MEVSVKTCKEYTVKMSEEEVEYLKGLTQNYLGGRVPEGDEKRTLRERIWRALEEGK